MKKIFLLQFLVLSLLFLGIFSSITNTVELKYELDPNNKDGASYWTNIPLVSSELLNKGLIGGEGGQWPLVLSSSNDGKYLFYGTDVGGIYRSTDKGKTWDKSMKDFTAGGASDIAVDPNNSNRVLALGVNNESVYTTGIYLSSDGGASWRFMQNFMISGYRDTTENLAYDATSYDENLGYSTIAYLSLIYETDMASRNNLETTDTISDSYTDGKSKCNKAGLYKTSDGGKTWNMISNNLYDGIVKVSSTTGYVFVAKRDGLYLSKNKGESFTKINSEYILSLDIIDGVIYFTTDEGLYLSKDGENFTLQHSNNFPKQNKKHPINLKVSPVNPKNMIFFFGKESVINGVFNNTNEGDIYYTEDGGKNWQKSTYNDSDNFLHYILERTPNFLWSTEDSKKVWNFTTDWISSSSNGGKEFKWDSNGLNLIHAGSNWRFNINNPNLIYLGAQDYNGFVTLDGGKTWKFIDLATYSNEYGEKNWKYNGHVYAGYAASETTYFGATSKSWLDTKYLTITHDGGKTHTAYVGYEDYALSSGYNNRLKNQTNYSSYQSPKNPNILFCGDLRSSDGGYTWSRMVDSNGEVAVTGVYTHNKNTGRLFGINDFISWVVYSDDDGLTWHKYNKKSLNEYDQSPYLSSLSYDTENDKLYVAWDWIKLSVISNNGEKIVELTKNIPKSLQFDGAPTKEQIGSNYYSRRLITVAVDPNYPSIIYAGGAANRYRSDSSIYRSVDGGQTWNVVNINGTNSIIALEDGDYGGFEPISMNVNPATGDLWVASSVGGLSKLTPPYENSKKSQIVVHYYLDKTQEKITNDTIINGQVGDKYNIQALNIEGYSLIGNVSSYNGKITRDSKELIFYYTKNDNNNSDDQNNNNNKPENNDTPNTKAESNLNNFKTVERKFKTMCIVLFSFIIIDICLVIKNKKLNIKIFKN